jgi:hypothetical protein
VVQKTVSSYLKSALFLGLFIGPSLSLASQMAIHIEARPRIETTDSRASRSCRGTHAVQFTSLSSGARINSQGEYEAIADTKTVWTRPKEWLDIAKKIFRDWVDVHKYTTSDKIPNLAKLDSELSPLRTSYIFFETSAEDRAGLRMFDGSTKVFKSFEEWPRASETDHRLPIERLDPDLKLPERENPNSYVVELGLLDVTQNVSQGMRWVFSKAAFALDDHYNNGEFVNFGRTNVADKLKVKVYAQTREEQVATFERFGLKPVLDSNGAPTRLRTGLILLSANAGDFISKNYLHQHIPSLKNEPGQRAWSESNFREQAKLHHEDMRRLESLPLDITSPHELPEMRAAMIRLLSSARTFPAYSQAQGERLVLFLRTYFRVVNAMPPGLRAKNWNSIKRTILHAMSQSDPQAAYLVLWMHFGRPTSGWSNQIPMNQFEARFYQNMPILQNLPFGAVTD